MLFLRAFQLWGEGRLTLEGFPFRDLAWSTWFRKHCFDCFPPVFNSASPDTDLPIYLIGLTPSCFFCNAALWYPIQQLLLLLLFCCIHCMYSTFLLLIGDRMMGNGVMTWCLWRIPLLYSHDRLMRTGILNLMDSYNTQSLWIYLFASNLIVSVISECHAIKTLLV